MTVTLKSLQARWMVCVACVVVFALIIGMGGCPGATSTDPNSSDPNAGGSTGGSDPNAGGSTGGSDPNAGGSTGGSDPNASGGTGSSDPNASGGTGASDPNASGGTGGSDPNASGGGGGTGGGGTTPPPAPTSITLTSLAKTGDAVPGQSAGITFTTFNNPVIDSKGRVAFWGLYQGANARGTAGLYIWDGTTLDKVVNNDPNSAGVLPGRQLALVFRLRSESA